MVFKDMMHIKIKLIISSILVPLALYAVEQKKSAPKTTPNFEFWNKTEHPIYISLGYADPKTDKIIDDPLTHDFKKIEAGKWATEEDLGFKLDLNNKTLLYIRASPEKPHKDDRLLAFRFKPHKTMYVRLKKEKNQYVFGTQTGPLLGLKGKTQRGYSLKNNPQPGDIIVLGELRYMDKRPAGQKAQDEQPIKSAQPKRVHFADDKK